MYKNFYQLDKSPFQITTDPAFLWLGEKYNEALSVLKYGILENRGFLMLTGDVGTGKTTLIHSLLKILTDTVVVATVPDPGLNSLDFYRYVADAYEIREPIHSKVDFLFKFKFFLKTAEKNRKRVLLLIDEAQRMTLELLEDIRLLSNIELPQKKMLNIFFIGHGEFVELLHHPKNRALRQRIAVQHHLSPLDREEVGEYIRHRLKVAGCRRQIFTEDAVTQIHGFSKGLPRLVNIVCDHAMFTGLVRKSEQIGEEIILECTKELDLQTDVAKTIPASPPDTGPNASPTPAEPGKKTARRRLWPFTFLLPAILL